MLRYKKPKNSRLINGSDRMGVRMLDSNWYMYKVNAGNTNNLFDHQKNLLIMIAVCLYQKLLTGQKKYSG